MSVRTITTYCEFHLGDNFAHLHLVRRLAKLSPDVHFVHHAHLCYHEELRQMVKDLPNVELRHLEQGIPGGAVNVWKNAGGFWERHPDRNDYTGFYLQWYQHLAGVFGLPLPLMAREEMRFDYPALEEENPMARADDGICAWCLKNGRWMDFLIVNSKPASGQLPEFDNDFYFEPLLWELSSKGYGIVVTHPTKTPIPNVYCTRDYGLNCTQIGTISMACKHHIMVSTGPSWPVLSKWNHPRMKAGRSNPGKVVVLLARERLNFEGVEHTENLQGVFAIAKSEGWL